MAEDPKEYVPLVSLIGQTVEAARATLSGELILEFSDGSRLSAKPDPRYEAWNLTVEALFLVCLPGGGIAAADSRASGIVTCERVVHRISHPDAT